MVKDIGMTNKQFQGFIRLALGWLEKALEESPAVKCSTGYSLCLNLDTDDTGKPILLPELVIHSL